MEENKALIKHGQLDRTRVRVVTASDPLMFVALVLGIIVAGTTADLTPLLIALGLGVGCIGASPWVPTLASRAIRRDQRKAQRLAHQERRAAERRVLRQLPPPLAERYLELKVRIHDVPRSLAQTDRDAVLEQVHAQLRDLLTAYLRLLSALHNMDQLLTHVDEIDLYRQLDQLDFEIRQAPSRLAAVKSSRREILMRRKVRLEEAREHREIVLTQLEMVEDVVSLLRDSTLAAPDPMQLNQQLADLMIQIEAADEAVYEVSILGDDVEELAYFEARVAG